MIHLYGVVDELVELPPVAGVGDAPLERQRVDGVEVVVSRSATERGEVSEETVLRHAQVVEGLMARSGAVLPAQLGREFTDESELVDAVRTKATELERGLDRVRGCVEFGLRVFGRDEPADERTYSTGADYMDARLAELRLHDRLARELHEPLAQLSRDSERIGGSSSTLLNAAYLVPRDRADEFRERVVALEAAHSEVALVCTGPWPPYSFADDGDER